MEFNDLEDGINPSNANSINERLNKLRTEIQDLYNLLRLTGEEFSVTTIKDELLQKVHSKGILEIFDYYLDIQI